MSDARKQLRAALNQTIIRVDENPRLLFEKTPSFGGGLNADEINRLVGRSVFEEKSGDEDTGERWLIVNHPDGEEPVRWRIYSKLLGPEVQNPNKLERLLRYLRAWQDWATAGETMPQQGPTSAQNLPGRRPELAREPMADSSPLAGLLHRAGNVFSLADQLGFAFRQERVSQGEGLRQIDPKGWERHQPAFNEYCAAVLDLREAIQNPPDGFAPVAQALLKAAEVAKQIRDAMQTAEGQTWAEYLEYFPNLNSVATLGREAIRVVTKARRLDDPFAFVDQPAARTNMEIDTTPTLPKPPTGLIESAERDIPGILANVQPEHDGAIELVASHLAQRLHDAKHTRAAAHWAIHEAIQADRLRAGRVAVEMPSVGVPTLGGTVWHGGERGTIAIPQGKPAPYDAFKVTATESLWTWWRSLDTAKPRNDEQPVSPNEPAGAAKPGAEASIALLRVFTKGLADERIEKAARFLSDDRLTANEKLT